MMTPAPPFEDSMFPFLRDIHDLETLAEMIRGCRNCDLVLQRSRAVPGEGNPHAAVMFIGEAPGGVEDSTGRPFVGPAGQFLDSLLTGIGLQRQEVFIGNVIRCRPPGNRDPLPDEVAACHPWVRAQLRIIKPRVVCALGRFAVHALIDPYLQISRAHGTPVERDGILYIPLYHPAAALHQQSLQDVQIQDMRKVQAMLAELNVLPG